MSMDTLVDGVHFDYHCSPYDLGWKSAAVNLSDLAACGAEPAWATLSLTLPTVDSDWLSSFSDGLFALLSRHAVQLIGGDTCRGPLSITVQAHGFVPVGEALLRDGASAGDDIYVSGPLGEAGLALWSRQRGIGLAPLYADRIMQALDRPEPCIALGQRLRGVATSAIDISDGLLADLGHICTASGVGAVICTDNLPQAEAFSSCVRPLLDNGSLAADEVLAMQMTAGDDYQLCFTAPVAARPTLSHLGLQRIGSIDNRQGDIRCIDRQGRQFVPSVSGFDHFTSQSKH